MSDTGTFSGLAPEKSVGEYNALIYMIQAILANVNTMTLCKVVGVTTIGDVAPVGFVDVQPLVNQLDGTQKSVPHETLHNLPYLRLQGGANAVIIDPEVGDIGIVGFADHDISIVKNTKAQANPASFRTFNMADGIYFGGSLNAAPTQYIQFQTGVGITIYSPTKININAPDVSVNCDTAEVTATTSTTVTAPANTIDGPLSVTGAITSGVSVGAPTIAAATSLTVNSLEMSTHYHGGVQTGSGNTGGPA